MPSPRPSPASGRGGTAGASGNDLRDLARRLLPIALGEMPLAQADLLRRHFDELVVLDELERLLERHPDRRRELHVVVLARGADVRELLGAERVDREVVVLGVDSDELAFVDLVAFADEEAAALLQSDQRV